MHMGMKQIQRDRQRSLKAILEEEGRGAQARLADLLDVHSSYISQLANGWKSINDEIAQKIERALGLGPGGLDLASIRGGVYAWSHQDELPGEHVMIRRIDAQVSNGDGNRVDEAPEKGQPLAFRREWVEARGYRPEALASLTCKGDSMEPVLLDGSSIVVNTADRTIQDGKMYVLRYDDEIRTKILSRRPGGGLTIASYNPQYQSFHLTPEEAEWVEILGKVVWYAAEP